MAIVYRRGQRGLHAFLADLLRNALGAAGVELRGIGTVGIGLLARRQQLLQLPEKGPVWRCGREAAGSAEMAGRANRLRQHQQRIVIAIGRNADHVKKVAGGFAFGPETRFGARPEGDFAFVQRLRQRLLVHIAVHQDLARYAVLHDSRHHAVGFFPVQLGKLLFC